MYDPLTKLIRQNYDIEAVNIKLITDHTSNNDSKVYLIESSASKYILKEMSMDYALEDEGRLITHLISKGIKVPKIYNTTGGRHVLTSDDLQYILYDYIEGTILDLNTAPDWFLAKSAQALGQIHSALQDFPPMPVEIGPEIFLQEEYKEEEQYILDKLKHAEESRDIPLIMALNERMKHIKKASGFEFDCGKFTYTNTHGDYYINQIIEKDGEFVIIDWTQAGYNPACFEVLISYAYAAPECKDGTIDAARLKQYISEYLKYAPFELTPYDLKMMPYLLYHHCTFWGFVPPYDGLPREYYNIASLTAKLANWLYDNVEALSRDLCTD